MSSGHFVSSKDKDDDARLCRKVLKNTTSDLGVTLPLTSTPGYSRLTEYHPPTPRGMVSSTHGSPLTRDERLDTPVSLFDRRTFGPPSGGRGGAVCRLDDRVPRTCSSKVL